MENNYDKLSYVRIKKKKDENVKKIVSSVAKTRRYETAPKCSNWQIVGLRNVTT